MGHDERPVARRASGDTTTDPEDEELTAALSKAAREAVRQPADPRIDRQLARMGLASPDEEETTASAAGTRVSRTVELEALRSKVEATGTALERVNLRLDRTNWVVALEGVAIAVLALLVLLR